jgi:hypothetical protein
LLRDCIGHDDGGNVPMTAHVLGVYRTDAPRANDADSHGNLLGIRSILSVGTFQSSKVILYDKLMSKRCSTPFSHHAELNGIDIRCDLLKPEKTKLLDAVRQAQRRFVGSMLDS